MELKVTNGEVFERGSRRYVRFSSFFVFLVIVSILYQNTVGALLVLFLVGGYLYYSALSTEEILISITPQALKIDNRVYPWSRVSGFVLENDPMTQQYTNLIFLIGEQKLVHTLRDDTEVIEDVLRVLPEYTNYLDQMPWTNMERLARRLKL